MSIHGLLRVFDGVIEVIESTAFVVVFLLIACGVSTMRADKAGPGYCYRCLRAQKAIPRWRAVVIVLLMIVCVGAHDAAVGSRKGRYRWVHGQLRDYIR